MKTVKIGNHTIEQYESIEELPMARYQKFNKYLLIDAGLGSDVDKFSEHANRVAAYIRNNNSSAALLELRNMTQCVSLVMSEMSPAFLAFVSLVKSVDSKEVTDLSEEGIVALAKELSDLPVRSVFERLAELKKKLETELTIYFPRLFSTSDEKEYYMLLRRRALLLAEQLSKKDLSYKEDELQQLEDQIATYNPPMDFTGSSSVEVKSDKQYQDGCIIIASQTNLDPASLSVLSYYNALEYIQEKQKERSKHGSKIRR